MNGKMIKVITYGAALALGTGGAALAGDCTLCPADSYADQTGLSECTPCAPGCSTNGKAGQISKDACVLTAAGLAKGQGGGVAVGYPCK
ncbi:MAG: hypothetical protein FWC51_02890 [Proteobacteria bacterium]|nr:hypothetical protein [Pseudomonadota bacterium]